MSSVKIDFTGYKELRDVFKEMVETFGPIDSKKILRKSISKSLQPVLAQARSLVPKDTGALSASLQIEARVATNKDKRSKYIYQTDDVIGAVMTASGKKLAKTSFKNLHNKSSKIKQVGIKGDARAIAVEFGTKNMSATPFLRTSLESRAPEVINTLSAIIKQNIEKFKSRKT